MYDYSVTRREVYIMISEHDDNSPAKSEPRYMHCSVVPVNCPPGNRNGYLPRCTRLPSDDTIIHLPSSAIATDPEITDARPDTATLHPT